MLTEKSHAGEFLIESTLDHHSRVPITIKSGLNLPVGTVLAIDATDSDLAKEFDNAVAAVNTVAGILWDAVDATDGDTDGVMVEVGVGAHIVRGTQLVWKTGVDAGEQTAAIAAMKLRDTHVR